MHPGVIEEYLLTAGNLKKSRDSNRRANANRQAFIEDGREKAIAEGKRTTKRKATIQPSRQAPIAAAPMPAAAPYATAASATNLFLDIQSNTAGQLVTATHLQMGPADAESSELSSYDTEEFSDLAEFDPDYHLDFLDDLLADDGGNTADVETTPTSNSKRKRGDDQVSVSKKAKTSGTRTL